MANTQAPSAPAELKLLAKLRDVREELSVIGRLVEAYTVASDADRPNRDAELSQVVTAERAGVSGRLGVATALLDDDPALASMYSDSVTRIENQWETFLRTWDRRVEHGNTAELHDVLRACVLEIAFLTVPPRANQNIGTLRVGGRMNFYDEFKEELPDKDMQDQILEWMSRHPMSVEGVIDLNGGMIVRADPRSWRRALSLFMVLGLGTLLVLAAGQSMRWQSWLDLPVRPELRGGEFVRGVGIAYAGALLHIAIAALKQQRTASATGARTFTALGNVLMWIHVNESALLFYTLVVPVTAVVFMVLEGKLVVASLFFVGYAIDSLLDTFVERFEKVAPRQTEVVVSAARG
jgi:hypothetical protein